MGRVEMKRDLLRLSPRRPLKEKIEMNSPKNWKRGIDLYERARNWSRHLLQPKGSKSYFGGLNQGSVSITG